MWLSTLTLLGLVSISSAKYGLYFTGDSSLKYDYSQPVDMPNNKIHIEFTIPLSFSQSLDISGLPIALLNITSTNLDSLTIEIHPGNYIFITVLAPVSAKDSDALGYCMYTAPLPSDTLLTLDVNRTGNVIEMKVTGEYGSVQCLPISVEPVTGKINGVQFVTIGYSTDAFQLTSFVGCIHAAVIDGIDLIEDICASPTQGKSTSNTFTFENDSCPAVSPTQNVECPATEPPTQPPGVMTQTNKTISHPSTLPTVKSESNTLPTVAPTDLPDEIKIIAKTDGDGIPQTDIPPAITKTSPENTNEKDNTVEKEGNEYEINETDVDNITTDEALLEKSTSEDDGNSLIIIICVVVGGVIVVVILLTVGYKFHFRDKGSYKLEESKNFDNDGFNEFTDLNPNEKKNEEWYL